MAFLHLREVELLLDGVGMLLTPLGLLAELSAGALFQLVPTLASLLMSRSSSHKVAFPNKLNQCTKLIILDLPGEFSSRRRRTSSSFSYQLRELHAFCYVAKYSIYLQRYVDSYTCMS